ncbi:MAG TPA: hypothetical protein DDW54_04655 [Clostridiales bacterium]|nr:hypothetical protein [Clostridiales bacterium]
MITADYVALGVIVVSLLLGMILGFGRGLKFFTSGIFGHIIATIVCYFLFAIVYNFAFVQALLNKFIEFLHSKENGFLEFLITIRIDLIALSVVLFGLVEIARLIIVAIVRGILEIDNPVMKVINKLLGMALFLAAAVVITLIIFQIISWVGGDIAANFRAKLDGSVVKVDYIFDNNPLMGMVAKIKGE